MLFGLAPANEMSKRSYREALLSGKCPACREGDIFKYPFIKIAHFADMNNSCPHCGAGFEREPGFYLGSMYITYAFNTALMIAFGLALYFFVEWPEAVYLTLIALSAVLITPLSFSFQCE